ncbi:MAG: phosphoenolpyruvate-utilizing N-terminal domain-containing protein, partial [Planctomycetota bacterium]
MEILKGIGVSPGVAVSTAVVLDAEAIVIPKRSIPAERIASEVDRLSAGLEQARQDLTTLSGELEDKHGQQLAGIFNFHRGMLQDRSLLQKMMLEIEQQQHTAEYAVSSVMRGLAQQFEAMPDDYLSARVKDIYDIEKRLLRLLIGDKHESLSRLEQDVLVIAHDLLPSQTAGLDKNRVKGFATDVGGRTSHTAIVARAMNIPAVVGLGNATAAVNGGDTVIIDGTRGLVIIDPDPSQLEDYREYARRQEAVEADLATLRDLPAETEDGHGAALMANIEFPGEIEDALARGAQGIGLYR